MSLHFGELFQTPSSPELIYTGMEKQTKPALCWTHSVCASWASTHWTNYAL